MADPRLSKKIFAILRIEDVLKRNRALRKLAALRDEKAMEAFDAITPFLEHSDEKVRRRAGSALASFPRQIKQRADVLTEHLLHNSEPWVRLSCAIKLMSVETEPVTLAYRHALEDSFDKVVQLACLVVGPPGRDGEHRGARSGSWSHFMAGAIGGVQGLDITTKGQPTCR